MSRPLEIYVCRVTSLGAAGVAAYWAYAWRSPLFAIIAVALLIGVFRVHDYETSGRWWTYLVLSVGCAGLMYVLSGKASPEESRLPWLVIMGCQLAQAVTLILGRVRKVWSFTRHSGIPDWELPRLGK